MRNLRVFSVIWLAVLAISAAVLLSAGPASAASNGEHDQGFTISCGGTTFSSVVSYTETGLGAGQGPNNFTVQRFSYHTTPAAQMNAISLEYRHSDSAPGTGGWAFRMYGWPPSTLNDNASSGVGTTFANSDGDADNNGPGYNWPDGTTPYMKVTVWGGVGNSTAGPCSKEYPFL